MPSLVPFKKVANEILQEVAGFDSSHPWRDHIVGGQAEGMDPNQFDIDQLSAGVTEEMEHTSDPNVAAEIAMDHLSKDPDYYKKLKLIDPGDAEEAQAKIGAAKTAGIALAHKFAKEAGLWDAMGAASSAVSGGAIAPSPSRSQALASNVQHGYVPRATGPVAPPGSPHGLRKFPMQQGAGALMKAPAANAAKTVISTPPTGLLAKAKAPVAAAGAGANAAKAVTKGVSGAAAGAKKIGLGRLGLLGAAGLGAYGLYKAVPKVVQMAREEGSMPQAAGGGWSPVPYGYGHTPWGNAAPNMGAF